MIPAGTPVICRRTGALIAMMRRSVQFDGDYYRIPIMSAVSFDLSADVPETSLEMRVLPLEVQWRITIQATNTGAFARRHVAEALIASPDHYHLVHECCGQNGPLTRGQPFR